MHLAALLTFLERESGLVSRAALLRLWALHHNANVTQEALGFFARADLPAYAVMVEAFFREHLAGNFEKTLIAPLAIMWRDQAGDTAALQIVLNRWLRLIFPGGASGSKDGHEVPPASFTAATTPHQLRLSYVAISVISFRPDHAFLPSLADCYKSSRFCFADRGTSDHIFRISLKSPAGALGALVRWHYGEKAILSVAQMAQGSVRDGSEPAATLRLVDQMGAADITTLNRTLDWTLSALWERRLNDSDEVCIARRADLVAAPNDEVLLWHSLAANSLDNAEKIVSMAADFLRSSSARDRALGADISED